MFLPRRSNSNTSRMAVHNCRRWPAAVTASSEGYGPPCAALHGPVGRSSFDRWLQKRKKGKGQLQLTGLIVIYTLPVC